MSLLRLSRINQAMRPFGPSRVLCGSIQPGASHDITETCMSPYKGGPVYQYIRTNWTWLRRDVGRIPLRWLERNWDWEKMACYGVPELHIDPTKNKWRYMIDTSYYGGLMDKLHEDFVRYIAIYPCLAFFFLNIYARWCDNDKNSFLRKWKGKERQ